MIAINNSVCEEEYGCRSAVPAVLGRGFTPAVWEPGARKPIVFEGEAETWQRERGRWSLHCSGGSVDSPSTRLAFES
ncbi:DddA-like double-stranded DNA deaminase toxin [Saccharopolyspora sp. ASAGF58]|uniref:DddA-like double-stranded DNA deaminase toxin n=1 Tax=Saccharopolyspora sp. ASAGF58 TaxID=2719023 RepID=UPI00144014E5|nr:hypothetical protein FDZ84_01000 [Saccharopolyspora sp. ASAGF58]